MKATELDRKFDGGEDITSHPDLSRARRPGLQLKRVNVDFPLWMVQNLDREARRLGVVRVAITHTPSASLRAGSSLARLPRKLTPKSPLLKERGLHVVNGVSSLHRQALIKLWAAERLELLKQ